MAENINQNANCFKEAVCIDAGRIYDSCCDKDCLEDLQVYFTDVTQPIIDSSVNVKCKKVEILNVFLEVEPVAFNRGFYSVDITFFLYGTFERLLISRICANTCKRSCNIFQKGNTVRKRRQCKSIQQ